MGQILNADFKPTLESLLKDASPQVRSQALRSLIRMKRRPKPEEVTAGIAQDADSALAQDTAASAPPEPAGDDTPQPADAPPGPDSPT